MAISVAVPKNLSGIKTKVAMNLTKRQLICFGSAAAVGIPFYLVTKGVLGTQASALIMVALMLPFFFLEEREKLKKEVRYLEEKAAGQQSQAKSGA